MSVRGRVAVFLLSLGLISMWAWAQTQTPPQKAKPPRETQTSSHKAQPPVEKVQTSSHKALPPPEQVQTPPQKAQPSMEEQTQSMTTKPKSPFALNYNVTISWVLKYGLGDSRGLSKKGYANVFVLEQHIALDVDGSFKITTPISGTLTISAEVDNQKSDNLQTFRMGFGNETWSLNFGDFAMGRAGSEFVASERTLKGLEGTYTPSESFKIVAQAALVEGEAQSRCFHGNTSQGQTIFSLRQPDQRGDAPYETNIKGLEYYPLTTTVVEGFTKVELTFPLSAKLRALLNDYGLDFIYQQVSDEPAVELDRFNYEIISEDSKYYLALKREARDLLRSQVRNYIDTYNEDNNLFGDKAKSYPLSEGTGYELKFLDQLAELVTLTTQEERIPLLSYTQDRFFYVGYSQISESSVKIEVKLAGQFVDINDPSLSESYKARIFPDQGILDLQIPEIYQTNLESEIRVSFDYAVSGQVYFLGLSVLKDSEHVSLNGKLLKRDEDYSIDYEVGALTLLRELGEDDKLCIDFELLRGGLGSAVDFQRTFVGSTFGWHPSAGFALDLDIFSAADSQPSPEGKERRNTMPNAHSVIGLTGQFDFSVFKSSFNIGFDQNVFPTGDPSDIPIDPITKKHHTNQKTNLPNQINAIISFEHEGQSLIAIGHQNGLSVFDGRKWEDFGPVEGLSGSTIYSIVASPQVLLIGTEFGLTKVQLEPNTPVLNSMAKQLNWKRYRKDERESNLPNNTVYSVFVDDAQMLWVGTAEGLARVPLNEIPTKTSWKIYTVKQYAGLLSSKILSLTGDSQYIYVGTDKGLTLLDRQSDRFEPVEATRNQLITSLALLKDSLYGATDKGVFLLTPDHTFSWVVEGHKVQTLAVQDDTLWYGTKTGFFKYPEETPSIKDRSITALGNSPSGLWVGPVALASTYELSLWRVHGDDTISYPQSETKIDGRDERRFAEIDSAQNTDYGWTGTVTMQFSLGGLQVSFLLESITPEFLAVAQEERRDVQQLTLKASYPFTLPLLGQMALSGQLAMGMLNLSPTRSLKPSGTMKDSFSLDWAVPTGTKLGLVFGLDQTENDSKNPGYDTQRYNYGITASQNFNLKNLLYLVESLSLNGSYNLTDNQVHNKKDANIQEERISAGSSLRLIGGLSFSGSYNQLSRIRAPSKREGDQSYGWRGDWNGNFSFLSITSSYSQNYRQKLTDTKGTRDDSANLDVRFHPIELGDLSLTPGGTGSLRLSLPLPNSSTPTTLSLQGEGRLRAEWLDLSGQTSYRYSLNHDKKRDQLRNDFSATVDWAGIQGLQPGLDLSLGTETLLRLDTKETKVTGSQSAGAHLDWEISADL
ncbi:hypothetical protein HY230_02530, partial [Candidatus Acetothermia bacterium]|nr:hypothetical protein [Candidatus Acetothermia bacterium]